MCFVSTVYDLGNSARIKMEHPMLGQYRKHHFNPWGFIGITFNALFCVSWLEHMAKQSGGVFFFFFYEVTLGADNLNRITSPLAKL